jgi:hypothetical protein
VLPRVHPGAGISRTDGIGPADPQQTQTTTWTLPANDLP